MSVWCVVEIKKGDKITFIINLTLAGMAGLLILPIPSQNGMEHSTGERERGNCIFQFLGMGLSFCMCVLRPICTM